MSVLLALDGHDASGKSTLARLLADQLDAVVVRPFAAPCGGALMAAAASGDDAAVLRVGDEALHVATESAASDRVVLDRSWITVATLARSAEFEDRWRHRFPTVVCWAGLDETLRRLGDRTEPSEPVEWHRRYIARYRRIAEETGVVVLRTDRGRSPSQCVTDLTMLVGSR